MAREVTEQDLRAPQFREGGPGDYEFRSDGKVVRKDRFQRGMQDIAAIVFGSSHDYEIPEVIAAIRQLQGIELLAAIEDARNVYSDEPKELECLDYVAEVLKAKRAKR